MHGIMIEMTPSSTDDLVIGEPYDHTENTSKNKLSPLSKDKRADRLSSELRGSKDQLLDF